MNQRAKLFHSNTDPKHILHIDCWTVLKNYGLFAVLGFFNLSFNIIQRQNSRMAFKTVTMALTYNVKSKYLSPRSALDRAEI